MQEVLVPLLVCRASVEASEALAFIGKATKTVSIVYHYSNGSKIMYFCTSTHNVYYCEGFAASY